MLISQIHESPEKEMSVSVEDIMPEDFARYLMNVINSNRQSSICFRYSQIAADEAVWKENPEHCGSAVTNVISQIRRKIGNGYIETVVGSGYRFVG